MNTKLLILIVILLILLLAYLILPAQAAPSNLFAILDVGGRVLYSYPGQLGSITYIAHTPLAATVGWCYHVNICADPITMEPGDALAETFNRPRVEYLLSGKLKVESFNYEMRGLAPKAFIPHLFGQGYGPGGE